MISDKAYAKVNIFLKITGRRSDGYHTIASRFMRVENLFDTIRIEKKDPGAFEIEGDFNCATHQNTIYKAYRALADFVGGSQIEEFFRTHRVVVEKNIPSFAGLGGGSSDAATFLKICNDLFSLGFNKEELARIGLQVGADVPFFIYDFASANVSGIGEVVEEFEERLLSFELLTPKIEISTPLVYKQYSKKIFDLITLEETKQWMEMDSGEVLGSFSIEKANDLYLCAKDLYPQLKKYEKPGWFFSGSGSTFFRVL